MKKIFAIIIALILLFTLSSCDLIGEMFGGDSDTVHNSSYEPLTGKFVLYKAADSRYTYTDTYFEIDGSKKSFTLSYYINGKLERSGKIQKVVTYEEKTGKWCNNLHINVKVNGSNEHISSYTESFKPLNQFRIIEEYDSRDNKYYLSEMPYIMGTYVREGQEFTEENPNTNNVDYTKPTLKDFTSALDGYFKLDDNHYFYFINPKGWATPDGIYLDSYYQYYSSELAKPIEGFARGNTFENESSIMFKTLKASVDWYKGSEGRINFGYYTFDDEDNMFDHPGTVDFSDGSLKSFTFEYLSRQYTDEELDRFESDITYHLPDTRLLDYVGGTYRKA